MAHAATPKFNNYADDDIPDRHYGKPYDRELYNQLAALMKLKEDEMSKDAAYSRRKGNPQMPPSERYMDLRKYLDEHQPEARTDLAMVACSRATRRDQCMRARADMMRANPAFSLTFSQRLGALGRTPSSQMSHRGNPLLVPLLADRLSRDPTDTRSQGMIAEYIQKRTKKQKPLLLLKNHGGKSRKSRRGKKSCKSRRGQKSCKSRNL